MKDELSPLQIALSKIPGWEKIEALLQNTATEAELAKWEAAFAVSAALDLDYDMSLPLPSNSGTARSIEIVESAFAATKLTGTTKVSIRIPTATVMAFKEKSEVAKVGYQTLINRVLKSAAKV